MSTTLPPAFTTEEALDYIGHAVAYAEHKFPDWPSSEARAVTILTEEVGKLARAVNELNLCGIAHDAPCLRDIQEYTASVGAVSVRVLKGLANY